ncbi:glycerol-3-phosphate dehydrogenase [Streptococcus pneumoniae]|nr:glycerol-3-phosphate dehydrogenase [Streptococcus pneumoniae]
MDIRQVTETIAMIEEQNFDIRTITMGISLLDCIDPDINRAAEKIYQKITTKAANLVVLVMKLRLSWEFLSLISVYR